VNEFVQIDKNSRIPVYVQMMNLLIKQIEDGTLEDDSKLPPERELCKTYGVSRSTVRQTIRELEKDGYVRISKGMGAFVARKQLHQNISSLYSFTEYMKNLGKTISTVLVDFAETECDERIARKMQCAAGTGIYRFTRIRFVDGEPVILVTTHLLCGRFPDFDKEGLIAGSLYTMMSDKYNVTFTNVKETLQIVRARKDEAHLLRVKTGDPCMKIDRYTFENDVLIEYAVGIARGDRFIYNVVLR